MKLESEYVQFIKELKQRIVSSRYVAARLINKEQLGLYFETGKSLSEKIATYQWGQKVIDQIAHDLQKDLPGLRGFSPKKPNEHEAVLRNIQGHLNCAVNDCTI